MMEDRELADKVASLGVIRCGGHAVDGNFEPTGECNYCLDSGGYEFALSESQIVRDWRVAGALMERVGRAKLEVCLCGSDPWQVWVDETSGEGIFFASNESAARAIIEACVTALEQ